jgi:hypothetical protein
MKDDHWSIPPKIITLTSEILKKILPLNALSPPKADGMIKSNLKIKLKIMQHFSVSEVKITLLCSLHVLQLHYPAFWEGMRIHHRINSDRY